jgi:hypothetical protein
LHLLRLQILSQDASADVNALLVAVYSSSNSFEGSAQPFSVTLRDDGCRMCPTRRVRVPSPFEFLSKGTPKFPSNSLRREFEADGPPCRRVPAPERTHARHSTPSPCTRGTLPGRRLPAPPAGSSPERSSGSGRHSNMNNYMYKRPCFALMLQHFSSFGVILRCATCKRRDHTGAHLYRAGMVVKELTWAVPSARSALARSSPPRA